MRFMNIQRWLFVLVIGLVAVCAGTSNLWLGVLARDEEQSETTDEAASTSEAAALSSGEPTPDGTPAGAASIEQIVSGETVPQDATTEEETDPLIAELLAVLEQETFAAGETPYITRAGDFVTLDAMRRGEGTASVYQIGETKRVLRLDPFSVTSGPDLHVLLSQSAQPRTSADALLPTYLDLGALQNTSSPQNFELPTEIDLERYRSVVIYSMSLNIIYSTATLEEVRGR